MRREGMPAWMHAYRDVGGRAASGTAADAYRDVGGRAASGTAAEVVESRREQEAEEARSRPAQARLQGCRW